MAAETFTKRDEEFFVENGYRYWFHKPSSDGLLRFWICAKKKSDNCPVRIHTSGNVVVKRLHEHNHASDPAGNEVQKLRNQIKSRAIETVEANFYL